MKSSLFKSALLGWVCVCLAVAAAPVWGEPSNRISAVTVSPDGKQVAIRCDGQTGQHNAFVLSRPNRLVIDFDGVALGPVARSIPVNGALIKEIRVGYSGTRARVVIDLGDLPVPAYRTQKEANRVIVALGSPSVPVAALLNKKSVPVPAKPAASGAVAKPAPIAGKKDSLVALKSAGVADDLIVLELTDVKNPQRTCRLVLEVDMERLQVRRATMSDRKGKIESAEIAPRQLDQNAKDETPTLGRGPRREPVSQADEEFRKPAVRWGLPAVKRIGPRLSRNVENPDADE